MDAALAGVQGYRRVVGIVDCTYQLPVQIRAGAKAADIGVAGHGKSVIELAVMRDELSSAWRRRRVVDGNSPNTPR